MAGHSEEIENRPPYRCLASSVFEDGTEQRIAYTVTGGCEDITVFEYIADLPFFKTVEVHSIYRLNGEESQ